jgi:hypothetical protein
MYEPHLSRLPLATIHLEYLWDCRPKHRGDIVARYSTGPCLLDGSEDICGLSRIGRRFVFACHRIFAKFILFKTLNDATAPASVVILTASMNLFLPKQTVFLRSNTESLSESSLP